MPEKIAPPRWLGPVNAALLLARRLRLGWTRDLPVLTLPGRRTGRLRRTPVSVLELDDYLLSYSGSHRVRTPADALPALWRLRMSQNP